MYKEYFIQELRYLSQNDLDSFCELDLLNLLDVSDKSYYYANDIQCPQGMLMVVLHGNNEYLGIKTYNEYCIIEDIEIYNAEQISNIIVNSDNWYGDPIILVAGNAGSGDNCIAQKIANTLKVTVYAPINTVFLGAGGLLYVNDTRLDPGDERLSEEYQNSQWKEFIPM